MLKPHCCPSVGDVDSAGGVLLILENSDLKENAGLFLYTYIRLKFDLKLHQNNTKHMVTNNNITEANLPSFTLYRQFILTSVFNSFGGNLHNSI